MKCTLMKRPEPHLATLRCRDAIPREKSPLAEPRKSPENRERIARESRENCAICELNKREPVLCCPRCQLDEDRYLWPTLREAFCCVVAFKRLVLVPTRPNCRFDWHSCRELCRAHTQLSPPNVQAIYDRNLD